MMPTPAMEAALQQTFANLFGALEINLPGKDIRLLDGSAAITIDGNLFTGDDEEYGTLHEVEAFDDGMGDQAPRLSLTLLPASILAAETMLDPSAQGARVRVLLGAFIRETGIAVEDPILLFEGEVDQGSLRIGKSSRMLDYECAGGFERFFENQEGNRLAPGFHKSVWPGETGLDNVTGVAETIYWGSQPPKSSVVAGGGSSGFGRVLGAAVANL
jgi:hypothetical protein